MSKDHMLSSVALVGLAVFLYQMGELLSKIQSWEVLWNPPSVGQMCLAGASALVAVGSAAGLNMQSLLGKNGNSQGNSQGNPQGNL